MIIDVLTIVFLICGAFFLLVSGIGLIRFPDFYSRAHATAVGDTLGILLIMTGLILHQGLNLTGFKIALIIVFIMLTNPTATHALLKAALHFRLTPWFLRDQDREKK